MNAVVAGQSLSYVWLFVTPQTAACQAPLSSTISQSLLKLMSIYLVIPSNHLILRHPLLLLPSTFPSIRVFSNESALCLKYWSFSFSISPFNEYSGLICFRVDWFDLLAVQETPKSLLQQHSSKASILWRSALFTVWLLQRYVTTGIIKLWTAISPSYLFISNVLWDLWDEFPLSWFEIIFPSYHAT